MATILLICAGLGVILVQHASNFSNFEIYDFFQSFFEMRTYSQSSVWVVRFVVGVFVDGCIGM